MEQSNNSKVDKHFIYGIYKACRLCGAGAGYKMPIIQNVIDVDGEEVELKRKIRECVHIEVHQDDKMPPLICELCVDKVNDFYEFLEMCRQTNKRTRKILGLPMPTKKGSAASDDCILGVTEPVYVNEDSDEPLSKSLRNAKQKVAPIKLKKVEVMVENLSKEQCKNAKPPKRQRSPTPPRKSTAKPKRHRSPTPPRKRHRSPTPPRKLRARSPSRQRSPTPPPRVTRNSRSSNEDNQSLSSLQSNFKRPTRQSSPSPVTPPPKSILKKEPKSEEKPSPKPKRAPAPEPPKPASVPQKKVKLSVQPSPPPKPPPMVKCSICKQQFKTPQALTNHMRSHTVAYTPEKLACNACREWFNDAEDAAAHHKRHKARNRAYFCRGCDERYETYNSYQAHTGNHKCVPWVEVPDVQCPECWKYFPTNNLRDEHKCLGVDGRPGGKCAKCSRPYALLKNLKKHESTCTAKRRGDYIDPALLSKVRPLQIRVARCDPLLQRNSNGRYDVSDVEDYGLDPMCIYPYIYSAALNFNRMVNIKSDLDFYCEEDYIHWDSEISDDDDERFLEREKKVPSLTTIALKTLFSQKLLGRVPRKKRKIKSEKSLFDVIMGADFDIDISKDINNIIDNLTDDDNSEVDRKEIKNERDLDESVKSEDTNDGYPDDKTKSTGDSVSKESTDSKVDGESNEKDTEQVKDASELSANTNSVSESLEVNSGNKDINKNNDNAESDVIKMNEQNNIHLGVVDAIKESHKEDSRNSSPSIFQNNSNDDSQSKEDKIENNDDNVQTDNNDSKSETNIHNTDDVTANVSNNHKENNEAEDKTPQEANGTDKKNINGVEEKSDKLNMEDFKETCDSKIDDAKLMRDLNDHIGETDEKMSKKDSSDAKGSEDKNNKDKDSLVGKKDSDARSMDLDSISDEEFNFDN